MESAGLLLTVPFPPYTRLVKDGEDEFQPVPRRLTDFYERYWGKRKDIGSKIFYSCTLPTIEGDESAGSVNDKADLSFECDQTVKIMDLGEDLRLFLPNEEATKLLVREEYEQASKAIEQYRGERQGGLFVNGMPGIGKTCFLIFQLISRLLDKQPTFFQMELEHIYFFCERGAFEFRPTLRTFVRGIDDACNEMGVAVDFTDGPLFLIDCNASLTNIPHYFGNPSTEVFIVQAASQAPRCGRWVRYLNGEVFDMKPWTQSEIASRTILRRLESPISHEIDLISHRLKQLAPVDQAAVTDYDSSSMDCQDD